MTQPPSGQGTGPVGSSSITPHLNLAANAASVANAANAANDATLTLLPTFTADDVTAWIQSHSVVGMLRPTDPVKIVAVQFITRAQFAQAFQHNMGLTSGTPICVALLEGNFKGMAVPVGIKVTPKNYAYLTWNGVTGNIVGWGTLRALPTLPATPMTGTSPSNS